MKKHLPILCWSMLLATTALQADATVDLSGLRPLVADFNCSSDLAAHGQPADQPMDPDPVLKANLMKQISEQNIRGQPCWYQTKGGEIYGHFHSSCGSPVNFHFQNSFSGWTLSSVEVRSCPPGPGPPNR